MVEAASRLCPANKGQFEKFPIFCPLCYCVYITTAFWKTNVAQVQEVSSQYLTIFQSQNTKTWVVQCTFFLSGSFSMCKVCKLKGPLPHSLLHLICCIRINVNMKWHEMIWSGQTWTLPHSTASSQLVNTHRLTWSQYSCCGIKEAKIDFFTSNSI